MITRAQAEALLTLAESLEACERLGLGLAAGRDGSSFLTYGASVDDSERLRSFDAISMRLAVNALITKQET